MDIVAMILVLITAIALIRSIGIVKHNVQVEPPTRLCSEIEIAAKSIGYWENRSLTGPPEDAILCVKGLLAAQRRLIALTGDYVPDEAKTVLDTKVVAIEALPEGVVSLDLARKSEQGRW